MYVIHEVVNMHEAKTYFSKIVDAVMHGREIVIAKAGKPVARLVPLKAKKTKVRFGLCKGKFKIAEDFDAPLSDEMIALFEGR